MHTIITGLIALIGVMLHQPWLLVICGIYTIIVDIVIFTHLNYSAGIMAIVTIITYIIGGALGINILMHMGFSIYPSIMGGISICSAILELLVLIGIIKK